MVASLIRSPGFDYLLERIRLLSRLFSYRTQQRTAVKGSHNTFPVEDSMTLTVLQSINSRARELITALARVTPPFTGHNQFTDTVREIAPMNPQIQMFPVFGSTLESFTTEQHVAVSVILQLQTGYRVFQVSGENQNTNVIKHVIRDLNISR